MRGENPDVPVTPVARYPILDPFANLLANIHAYATASPDATAPRSKIVLAAPCSYSAMLLVVLLWIMLIRPKGSDPDPAKAKSHMYVGRISTLQLAARACLAPPTVS